MSFLKNKISRGSQNLCRILNAFPPDISKLRKELQTGKYSSKDVTAAALQYLDDCFDEQLARSNEAPPENRQPDGGTVYPGMRSFSLPDVIELLLRYGLDPNAVTCDGKNVMRSLHYIDNGYLAADALALLFENGASHTTSIKGEDLFSRIDFDVIFGAGNQENRRRYDALVHCWFVYLGYGAKPQNGTAPLDVCRGFDLSELKDHRNFTFALSYTPNRGENWTLHIIDRRTFWEVARL